VNKKQFVGVGIFIKIPCLALGGCCQANGTVAVDEQRFPAL